jgi:predicted RNA binding protein YcfA (HicA-like mRNA interferase family)
MGSRRFPPLRPREVIDILDALGFKFKRQSGSHAHYERLASATDTQRRIVTVDTSVGEFDDYLIKSMLRQSGETRERFYLATSVSAKKIR